MALKGTVTTNEYRGRFYRVDWEAKQDIANNETTITWSLIAGGDSGWLAERDLILTIDGKDVFYKTERVERYAGSIATGTVKLKHEANGEKSFYVSIQAAVYYSSITCSASNKFTLDTIPRAAKIVGYASFSDEENPDFYYSNPAGENVSSLQACISLDGVVAAFGYQDVPKTATKYEITLTEEQRRLLRMAATENILPITFILKTIIDGYTFTSTATSFMRIHNPEPAVFMNTIDTNETTKALTNDTQFVKYMSNLSITVNAIAKKETAIKEITVKVGSRTNTYAKVSSVVVSVEGIADKNIEVSVEDYRGNITKITKELTMLEYIKPTCNIAATAKLASDNTTTINFTISGSWFNGSFGTSQNDILVRYTYKTKGGSYPSAVLVAATKSGNTYKYTGTITGLDYQSSYVIKAGATDSLATVNSKEIEVRTTPVFDWDKDDFNLNVPLYMNGKMVFRENANNVVISGGNGGSVYIRPNGTGDTAAQFVFGSTGNMEIRGDLRILGGLTVGGKAYGTNRVLWSGTNVMSDSNTITLSESVSSQVNGIVLVFSRYSGTAALEHNYSYHFVPKQMVSSAGGYGSTFMLASNSFANIATKYLYFADTTIKGHTNNSSSGTANGITYKNGDFALRYVLGV